MSTSLDWLALLGLASLASAWLVSSAAATTTATTQEQAYITIVAALRAAAVVVDASSGVVAVAESAADETSHDEVRLAKPSRQANQGRDSQMELGISVMAGSKPQDSQLDVELDTSSL